MGPLLLAQYTILDNRPPGFRFMKNTAERCAGLDVSNPGMFPCAIYASRPEDCRIVEPGSPACLEARSLGHLGKSLEFIRAPDAHLVGFAQSTGLHMGQWLSVPMIAGGLYLVLTASKREGRVTAVPDEPAAS